MKAIDGPFEGKEYVAPDTTQTIFDSFRTEYDFYLVEYRRTTEGWVCSSVQEYDWK